MGSIPADDEHLIRFLADLAGKTVFLNPHLPLPLPLPGESPEERDETDPPDVNVLWEAGGDSGMGEEADVGETGGGETEPVFEAGGGETPSTRTGEPSFSGESGDEGDLHSLD